ncbi:prepilin peptidase, partial [uncultured Psychrobacter sp.]|uniref:prepilin peptidase n=1 Tax=uncultured Psychrobacter sp. TaxID=259303 RepID=UPI0032B1D515
MQLLELLQNNMSAALIVFGLLGLCVGSFLNVVIHRMPLMMFYSWRQECSEFMSQQSDIMPEQSAVLAQAVANDTPITLSRPASRCPHCAHKIKWYENIPLVSWLALRGRCSECQASIGVRYPVVELVTALLSALVIYHFGVSAT